MVESNKLPIRYPEFAERVKIAMANGKWEVQGIVDALKQAGVRITYEMVRRYTLGQAMPRQDKMAHIAQILGVSPSFLQYGLETAPPPQSDDTTLVEPAPPVRSPFYPFLRVRPEDYAALDEEEKDELELIIELRIRRTTRTNKRHPSSSGRTGTDDA